MLPINSSSLSPVTSSNPFSQLANAVTTALSPAAQSPLSNPFATSSFSTTEAGNTGYQAAQEDFESDFESDFEDPEADFEDSEADFEASPINSLLSSGPMNLMSLLSRLNAVTADSGGGSKLTLPPADY